ncbi:MAG: aminotransferase class V-fold PLP-dependent enzyme, partial [Pseudarthrobacter sp.]
GLAFVAANDKAHRAHERADMKTLYWDWTARQGEQHYMKYCGTPPEHLLFGLRAALDMILEEGLEAVWKRHALLAAATHAAIGKWSEGQVLACNVTDPAHRACSVTLVVVTGADAEAIAAYTQSICGVTLGSAIGDLAGRAFRHGELVLDEAVGAVGAVPAREDVEGEEPAIPVLDALKSAQLQGAVEAVQHREREAVHERH